MAIQRVELTHDVLTPVVRKSRDERQSREAMLRAEQQAQEMRETSRRQRRRLGMVIAGMAAALVVVSGVGVGLLRLYNDAKHQLAMGLILQGDALRLAGRCSDSRRCLMQSLVELNELGLSSLGATLVLWDLYYESPPELMTFAGHTAAINSLAISPDGHWALSGSGKDPVSGDNSGSDDTTVRLWDLVRGVEKWTLSGHTLRVRSVCFSPDGLWALSGSDDNTIKLWDLVRGEEKRTLSGHTGSVRTVCFSPDGHWGLSGSDDDTVRLWDLESGTEKTVFSGHVRGVTSVAFSPDGRTALSGGGDKTIKRWDLVLLYLGLDEF